jgi:hypothetical protein
MLFFQILKKDNSMINMDMLVWMAARDAGVAEPLSIKSYVDHVPNTAVPPGMETGILHKEVKSVFVGVKG